jgi:hypothetical protein
MKTIMSRHFPPLPIQITYKENSSQRSKDLSRVLAALKRPDRIRGIAFTGSPEDFSKLFKATKCPFPALESLELCGRFYKTLKIPVTFLKGSDLHLQTLSLHYISPSSISRFLSFKPTLTHLDITINSYDGPEPTKPEKNSLSKLTSFRYRGHSTFLNTLITEVAAPSLREVDIQLHDRTLPPIPYFPQFINDINDIKKHCHAVQLSLDIYHIRLSLLSHSEYADSEYAGHHLPRFRLRFFHSPGSVMQMSGAIYSKLSTAEELSVVFLDDAVPDEDIIPWRKFFLQFPSVKVLRMYGTNGTTNLYIAGAFHQDHESLNLAFLPALEKIEFCMGSKYRHPENQCASELAAFEPFVLARQQAGLPVKIVATRGNLVDLIMQER